METLMSLGLGSKFNILQQSPHDLTASPGLAGSAVEAQHQWVASRYTVRATADDGRLVLWNTLSGKVTVFKAEDREPVLGLLTKTGFQAPRVGVVEYLADRGYLVRRGVDEYRQFQQLFGFQHYRSDTLELILMSSEDCNFRCTYCYEDFKRGTMLSEVREGVKNLVRKRIKKLNQLNVSWFGGEPLYGWGAVEDLSPFFLDIANEHEVPYSGHMTTNGYLLTPEVAEKLLSWKVHHFQITLDGLPQHHDRSRCARDGSPTFQQIFDNLTSLSQRDAYFHVTLRVNFDQNNASDLPQFVDLLSSTFVDDHRFSLSLSAVGKWGGPNDAQLDVCGGDDAANIRQRILDQAKRQGLNISTLRDTARLGSQVCYAARPYNYLIGATGKVMKCTIVLDTDESNVVGRITPEGDLELDQERMALWTEPAFEQDSQCRKCIVLPNCQGISCPLIRMQNDTQPCISARRGAKSELVMSLDVPGNGGRRVQVQSQTNLGSADHATAPCVVDQPGLSPG